MGLCYECSIMTKPPRTTYAFWRATMRYTHEQAAALLGVSPSRSKDWERGVSRSRGNLATPPYAVLCLMTTLVRGEPPQPWGDEAGDAVPAVESTAHESASRFAAGEPGSDIVA